jgi:hypothetical protein
MDMDLAVAKLNLGSCDVKKKKARRTIKRGKKD